MHTVPTIPGVTLEVYKQHRQLTPEPDGYVGQLYSGFAVILAVIDPTADPTIGLFRDGQDHYILQKDWLNNPRTEAQRQAHTRYFTDRRFAPGTKVYGIKMPLRVDEDQAVNTVHYPENMFVLAQYYCSNYSNPVSPDYVLVWKVALVSQNGEFFLTIQEAYDVMICQSGDSKPHIPRLHGHRQLEQLILANMPEGFRLCTGHADPLPEGPPVDQLGHDEGIVEGWYAARNMGCIITAKGAARVHWSEVPPRPRRRFLVIGERVRFASLRTPPPNPRTEWRKVRKARFQLQACGVELC